MKKIITLYIVLCLIFGVFAYSSAQAENNKPNKFVLNGIIVSHIPANDLLSVTKGDIKIGLEKVDNSYDLTKQEYFANYNSVPLFAKVNLLYQKFTDKKELSLFDLEEKYTKLKPEDYFERERIIGITVSGIHKGNSLVSFTEKTPPKIQITYKKVSTGRRSSYIPIRVVSQPETVDTYFLLDPFAKPSNERLNNFDIVQVYDVEPCFSGTVAERKISGNYNIDFSGFYIDVPDRIPPDLLENVENSIDKFEKYVHKNGKLLIVENLNKNTIQLGKYGDLIGINYNDNGILQQARTMYPDKIIFATIDTSFKGDNLKQILRNLALFGIYPEFGRDTDSGDFFYYEDAFKDNVNLINKYVDIITLENGFTFKSISKSNDLTVSTFVSKSANLTVAQGTGKIDTEKKFSETYDIQGNSVKAKLSGKIQIDVNGINLIYSGDSAVYLLGIVPQISKKNIVFIVKNFSDAKQNVDIFVKSGDKTVFQESSVLFLPLSLHPVYSEVKNNPIFINVCKQNEKFNINNPHNTNGTYFLIVFLILLAFLYLIFTKKIKIPRLLNVKSFLLSIIILPSVFILLNTYIIHYSIHTITYFIFALMYFILALYDADFYIQSVAMGTLMVFLGVLYNFLEYRTLAPHFYTGVLPFNRYNLILFILPFILSVFFFSSYGGKRINKLEIAVLIIAVAVPVFLFNPSISPFVLNLSMNSAYPIFIVLIAASLLGVLHKRAFIPYLVLFGILVLLLFVSLNLSNLFYASAVFNSYTSLRVSLIMKDFILFVLPIFFILLLHHNIVKTSPHSSINIFTTTILSIITITTFLAQWDIKFRGTTAIDQLVLVPACIVAIFLFFIVLLEPMKSSEEF